jgi:hypothetical protein
MKKKIKKISNKIAEIAGTAIAGAESAVINPSGDVSVAVVSSLGKHHSSLGDALVRGELTQEVKEFRDSLYAVSLESDKKNAIIIDSDITEEMGDDNWRPFADAFTIPAQFNKPSVEEIEKDYKTVLVQNTEEVCSGVAKVENEKVVRELPEPSYPLSIERDFYSSFPIEKHCSITVVKENINDPSKYRIDLYFTVYPDNISRIKRFFTNRVARLYEQQKTIRDDNLTDIRTLRFITRAAWGDANNMEYKFNITGFAGCSKFNGHYILKFDAEALVYGKSVTEKYRSEELRKKYETKERKQKAPRTVNPFNVPLENDEKKCEVCGRILTGAAVSDWFITKNDFGRGMCSRCLMEYTLKKQKTDNEKNGD